MHQQVRVCEQHSVLILLRVCGVGLASLLYACWLAGVSVHAQQAGVSLFDALKAKQVTASIFGRSTSFDEPMLMVEVTNAQTTPITLTVPPGAILRSQNPAYCDVTALAVEPALALAGRRDAQVRSAIYGYCLQPAPGERRYPPPEATYELSGELAGRPVQLVLAAIPANEEARRDLSAQVAVWIAQGVDSRETLQRRSGYADLAPYWDKANAYLKGAPPATVKPATPVAAITATGARTTASPTVRPTAPPIAAPATPIPGTRPASSGVAWPGLLCIASIAIVVAVLAFVLIRSERRAARDAETAMPPVAPELTDPGQPSDSGWLPPVRPVLGPPPTLMGGGASGTGTQPLAPRQAQGQMTGSGQVGPSPAPEPAPGTAPLPRAYARPDHSKTFQRTVQPAAGQAFVQLVAEGGPLDKHKLEVPPGGGLISRLAAEFLVLPDPKVSTPHAAIRLGQGQNPTFIWDLGSREGTWLNGQRLPVDPKQPGKKDTLANGDQVKVGDTLLRYDASGLALITVDGKRRYSLAAKSLWIVSPEKLSYAQGMDRLPKGDPSISSPHAMVEVGPTIRIVDLNSTNQTMVQGRALPAGQKVVVRDGWTVQISDTKFIVHTNVAGLPELIAGRFRVQSWITCGGMADVFAVQDVDLGIERALKVIRSRFLSHEERLRQLYLDAFRQEAQRSQAVLHPGFVKVHAAGDDPDVGPYLVMDLVNGPSVEELVGQHGALPLADAVEITCQAGEALHDLHEKQHWVHCDVAPKNLMVDQRGLVYLLDLGIAMKEGERQPDFASDGYMAPELWRGEPAEPSADVYSLGVTFFEMATGERYPSVNGSARSVQGSTDPNLGQARQALMARLPQQIAAIIARALQDDPRQRYPGMAELLANLAPHRKGADLSRLLTWWIQPGQPVPAAAAPRSGGAGPSGPPVAPSGPGDAGQSTAGQAVCPSCERPLRDTARFCDACGQPITGAQPAVPAIPAVSAIPAVPATVACPACGHENRAGARFCNMCRQQL